MLLNLKPMENKISIIKNPRKIDYHEDLLSDNLSDKIYEGEDYEFFKLKIKQRHIQTVLGEINFLVRDKTNPLRHILVYCYMMEPDKIFKLDYYINDIIQLENKEVLKIEPFLDLEVAELLVKDLFVNYIQKKYETV